MWLRRADDVSLSRLTLAMARVTSVDVSVGSGGSTAQVEPMTSAYKLLITATARGHCFKYRPIYWYIGRNTGILSKTYDKCKNLLDIILDRYEPIYRYVADKSTDIRDEISDLSAIIVTYLDDYYF